MYTENEPAMERNEAVVNDVSSEFFNDKFPDNCKYPAAFKLLRIKSKQIKKV